MHLLWWLKGFVATGKCWIIPLNTAQQIQRKLIQFPQGNQLDVRNSLECSSCWLIELLVMRVACTLAVTTLILTKIKQFLFFPWNLSIGKKKKWMFYKIVVLSHSPPVKTTHNIPGALFLYYFLASFVVMDGTSFKLEKLFFFLYFGASL